MARVKTTTQANSSKASSSAQLEKQSEMFKDIIEDIR
jgi:hypothetical protein